MPSSTSTSGKQPRPRGSSHGRHGKLFQRYDTTADLEITVLRSMPGEQGLHLYNTLASTHQSYCVLHYKFDNLHPAHLAQCNIYKIYTNYSCSRAWHTSNILKAMKTKQHAVKLARPPTNTLDDDRAPPDAPRLSGVEPG